MTAALIVPLLLQYGPGFVTALVTLLKSNPSPSGDQWLELLKHPSLTLTYDQQIESAEARANAASLSPVAV